MGWLKYMLTAGLLVSTVHTAIAGVVVGGHAGSVRRLKERSLDFGEKHREDQAVSDSVMGR